MSNGKRNNGFVFKQYEAPFQTPFDKLFDIFKELITHTSGDFDEAIDWLRQLDKEFKLTTPEYTVDDFIEDLKNKGYIQERSDIGGSGVGLTSKLEKALRQNALEQIFGKMRKGVSGNHKTKYSGLSDESTGDLRSYQYGDNLDKISMTESLKNAQVNHGIGEFSLSENDLVVEDTQFKSQMSTVLMIDISHSMILYGEDRITPAKKVAMALSELILTRYPKDSLDVIVFGNDAWPIAIKDLPYLQVGPFHTNTVAGVQLALDILRRKRHANKQIFMITDGKPSCLNMPDGTYYKNPMGLDPFITGKCYSIAAQARKLGIPITTFMITSDPYLQEFVDEFTASNHGKAYYTGLGDLGEMIFSDYEANRKKRIR
ncbi:vWA domain-containing protein [Sphingobacterium chungjuense]|uniref:vWA domain-containing protein n=1 Tax=Sphingobacterium chungjuense TaxID=2675553 RepID=UPI00140E5DD2|nr:hypothetical protein [Sphingobacterium chungjuense]